MIIYFDRLSQTNSITDYDTINGADCPVKFFTLNTFVNSYFRVYLDFS